MSPGPREAIRGPLKSIASSAGGVQICDRLPRLARLMDRFALVRSGHPGMKNHHSAAHYALTGHAPPVDDIRLKDTLDLFPAYGSVVDRLAPRRAPMPTPVASPPLLPLRLGRPPPRPQPRRDADLRRLPLPDPRRRRHARATRQLPRQGPRP